MRKKAKIVKQPADITSGITRMRKIVAVTIVRSFERASFGAAGTIRDEEAEVAAATRASAALRIGTEGRVAPL